MHKLLHEKLLDFDKHEDGPGTMSLVVGNGRIRLTQVDACNLAHEIKKCYIPRPRFEDGEPVQFGGAFADDCGHSHVLHELCYRDKTARGTGAGCILKATDNCGGEYDGVAYNLWDSKFVKRPTPKVYDADGVEIKVGDTVWTDDGEISGQVLELDGIDGINVKLLVPKNATWFMSNRLTHEKPVFDAEGERIKVGNIVYNKENGIEYKVTGVTDGGFIMAETVSNPIVGGRVIMTGSSFTHERPVVDADGKSIQVGDKVFWSEEHLFNPYTVTALRHDAQLIDHVKIQASDGGQEYGVHPSKLSRDPFTYDADGARISVGDFVWLSEYGHKCWTWTGQEPFTVVSIEGHKIKANGCEDDKLWSLHSSWVVHRATPSDADGKPIEVGDTVYSRNGYEGKVVEILDAVMVKVEFDADYGVITEDAATLTHCKPVLDADGKPI